MAIYHLNVKIIGRSSGRSSVAAAAYRSGDILTNEYDGMTHNYSRKGWIEHTEIILPINAPEAFSDRSTLWNAVEAAEKSANSQLAREVEVALPGELNLEQQTALLRAYIEENFVSNGMCADFAIHNPPVTDGRHRPVDDAGNPTNDRQRMIFQNPHAHIMLTMRPLDEQGDWQPKSRLNYLCRRGNEEKSIPPSALKQGEADGWKKQYRYQVGRKNVWITAETAEKKGFKRVDKQPKSEKVQNPITVEWNAKDSLFRWRESWANVCNQALRAGGIHEQIDHRSYVEREINQVATVHLGTHAHQAEKRGEKTELGNLNRDIQSDNRFLDQFKQQIGVWEREETERLKQTAAKLESLRAQHIVAAYQQMMHSASITSEKNQVEKQIASAGAYAKAAEQILKALDILEQRLKFKSTTLAEANPVQVKRRKGMKLEIEETEKQIQVLKNRLSELEIAYQVKIPIAVFDEEAGEQKQQQIRNLKEIQSQTYKEFHLLVEENKTNMVQLRALMLGTREAHDTYTEQRLKSHFAEKFQKSVLMKAREGAPELPEMDGMA